MSKNQTCHLNPEPRVLTSIARDGESGSLPGRGDLPFLATFYNEDSKAPLPKDILSMQTLENGTESLHLLPTTRFYSTPKGDVIKGTQQRQQTMTPGPSQ